MQKRHFLIFLIFLFFSGSINSQVPGTVIAHSKAETGTYLGSPSIIVLPSGKYIATLDYFGPGANNKSSIYAIYESKNKGKSWDLIKEMEGIYWSNLFLNNGDLYSIGTSKQYGDLVIRKSEDEGMTWTTPTDSSHGLLRNDFQYHTAPMPVVQKNGRIYRAVEVRSPAYGWGINFEALVMSAPIDANLLESKNWTLSNRIHYNQDWEGSAWLEGNIVETPAGNLINILRVHNTEYGGKAAWLPYEIETNELHFDPNKGFINFPGGSKKFSIRYDSVTERYWTLSNHIRDFGYDPASTRNCLAISSSPDLLDWTVHEVVLYHPDVLNHGFQYADWHFDGSDIIAAVRTAFDDGFGGANNAHDANYITFHRINDFRKKITKNIATYHNSDESRG